MRIAALIASLATLSFAADFETGRQAFEKGDYAAALKEWQPLAEQGAPFAAYNLGIMYGKGLGVKQDYGEAAKWYRQAAEKGIPEAEYNMGVLYANGAGVPKDYSEASKWFQKAAEKGDLNAANKLGDLYDAGEGSFKNYAEAAKWYRKGAEQGNAIAQFNLGVMYDIGQGVQQDFAEAEKWYRKAAEQWNEGALCNLAILYYNGQGVKRDLILAHQYFLLAKDAGDPRASNLIEVTTNKLNKKQMDQAEQMAAKFKDAHRDQIQAAKNPLRKPPSAKPDQPVDLAEASNQPVLAPSPTPPSSTPPSPAPAVASPLNVEAKPDTRTPAPSPSPSIPPALPSGSVWTGVDRVVAIGDVHGDYEQFTAVLRSAGLIDGQSNWAGGKTHLVQTGDVVDQGPDSRRIMDLLMKLESQAAAAGGRVHCLIGNHEAMDIYGDLRFVSPAGFAEYSNSDSEKTRNEAYEAYNKTRTEVTPRDQWNRDHPPGLFEHRKAFAPEGTYGKWILSHNTVIRINDTLFSHAGVGPKYAGRSLDDINRKVREELSNPLIMAGGIVTDLQGPLWYKGLSQSADPGVEQVLSHFDASREVVGHLDGAGAVIPAFHNKVIFIDVGLARLNSNTGGLACLVIDKDQLYALHRGQRLDLPKDDGPDMLRYLKQAQALEPEPSSLAVRIEKLEQTLGSKR